LHPKTPQASINHHALKATRTKHTDLCTFAGCKNPNLKRNYHTPRVAATCPCNLEQMFASLSKKLQKAFVCRKKKEFDVALDIKNSKRTAILSVFVEREYLLGLSRCLVFFAKKYEVIGEGYGKKID
jgi:hypothetical protein